MRVRQSSVLELGYDDRVALPVLDIILAIIVFIARRLLTIWIVALQSALAIIAFVPQINCDRSATSSGILYIFVVVMLVLSSVRKIGAVIFLAAITTLRSLIWLRSSLWPSTLIVLVSASSSLASSIVFRQSTSLPMVR